MYESDLRYPLTGTVRNPLSIKKYYVSQFPFRISYLTLTNVCGYLETQRYFLLSKVNGKKKNREEGVKVVLNVDNFGSVNTVPVYGSCCCRFYTITARVVTVKKLR